MKIVLRSGGLLLVLLLFVWLGWKTWQTYVVETTIREYAGRFHVSYRLARDIAKAESSLDPLAKGKDGGAGLYQFMPKTWAWATEKLYGKPLKFREAFDLRRNAEVGAWFISWITKTLKREGFYSEAAVIYCFNAGIGNFRERGYQLPKDHKNRVYKEYFRKYHTRTAKRGEKR